MNKLSIADLDFKGKRVFVRVDFNVPFDDKGNISETTRIRAALPTIRHITERGGRVVLGSHIGRPKGEKKEELSCKNIVKALSDLLGQEAVLAPDSIGEEVEKMVSGLGDGDVLLLENLRFYKEEEKNDEGFSKALAGLADIYVNDAFGTAHRAHASTEGITHHVEQCAAGFLLKKEMDYFDKAITNPIRPLVAILGGSKASGKIGVLHNLIDKVDKIICGGGLAFTFLKAHGFDVGNSLVEEGMIEEVKGIMAKAHEKGIKFYLPVDFVVADRFHAEAETKVVSAQEIPSQWMGLDIGPASSLVFAQALEDAKTIVWNGPMGVFEMDAFSRGTMRLAEDVAGSHSLTIVGGGDTDAAVKQAGVAEKMSFISTGGGASLELLEGKVLPGINALTDK